jgi:hypothetical protein
MNSVATLKERARTRGLNVARQSSFLWLVEVVDVPNIVYYLQRHCQALILNFPNAANFAVHDDIGLWWFRIIDRDSDLIGEFGMFQDKGKGGGAEQGRSEGAED